MPAAEGNPEFPSGAADAAFFGLTQNERRLIWENFLVQTE